MGCCVSANRGGEAAHLGTIESSSSFHEQKPSLESRAPPPSAEEETVKEVLSETPNPKAHAFLLQQPHQEENKKTQIEKPKPKPKPAAAIVNKERLNFDIKSSSEPRSVGNIEESASEDVSEICSVSLSESVSTITDRREEEEEVRQPPKVAFRSPARSAASRNRVVGRSPTRKVDQSPGRIRNGGSTTGRLQQVQSSSREPGRRGSRPDPTRKDPAESSGRRSRSPAVNRSVVMMGRSPSGKRTNRSPARLRAAPAPGDDLHECGGNGKKADQQPQQQQHDSTMEGKWPSSISSNNHAASATATTTTPSPNESLENPLVSLECFIFL